MDTQITTQTDPLQGKCSDNTLVRKVETNDNLLIDLYEAHKNNGEVYKMWSISKFPINEKEAGRVATQLEKLDKNAYKVVIKDINLPVAGSKVKAVIVGSGIMATVVELKLDITATKKYGVFTFFSDDKGYQYCMKPNEAN